MIDIEKFISDLHSLSQVQLVRLQEELSLLRAGIDASEPQSIQDFAPIDIPIESHKDQETGDLRIRYPFVIGMRNTLGWKELQVTPAAQAALLQIFYESLSDDAKAGRNQTIKTSVQ
jgi:hypothetical protein